MKFRRFLCLMAAMVLTVCLFPRVSATKDMKPEAEEIINACIYQRNGDLSDYDMTIEELDALYSELYTTGALPWYVSASYSYSYSESTGIVSTFIPTVDAPKDEDITTFEETAAQILQECVKPGMNQWQIALALHDYLILNVSYDESLQRHLPYQLLVEKNAVCSGYALAYRYLMQQVGIDCQYVVSDAMDHGWNMVKIDGNWYHVDLTWDDPSPNIAGYVDHQYFLVTDAEIKSGEKPHYDWDVQTPCTDTRFSDSFWREVKSGIWYESKDTSYLLRDEDYHSVLYRRDETTGKETQLYREPKDNAIDIGHGSYRYEHHGLTLRDGRLWFNAMSKVMSIKTDGTDLKTEYENTGRTYIFGCFAGHDSLDLSLNPHDGDRTEISLALAPSQAHQCNFIRTTTAPTCQEGGITVSVCQDCNLKVESVPTEITDHSYVKDGDDLVCQYCADGYTPEEPADSDEDSNDDYEHPLKEEMPLIIGGGVVVLAILALIFKKR